MEQLSDFSIWDDSQSSAARIEEDITADAPQSDQLHEEDSAVERSPRLFDPEYFPQRTLPISDPNPYNDLLLGADGSEWIPRFTDSGLIPWKIDDEGKNQTHRRPLQELDNCLGPLDDDGGVDVSRPMWHMRRPGIGNQATYDEDGAVVPVPSHHYREPEFQIYHDEENFIEAEELTHPAAAYFGIESADGAVPRQMLREKAVFERILELPQLHLEKYKAVKLVMEKAITLINILFHGILNSDLYNNIIDACKTARRSVTWHLGMPWTVMVEVAQQEKVDERQREIREAEEWNRRTRRRQRQQRIRRRENKYATVVDSTSKTKFAARGRLEKGGLGARHELTQILRI